MYHTSATYLMNKIIKLIMCVAFSATVSGQTVKVEDRVKTFEGDVKTLKGQVETWQGQIATCNPVLMSLQTGTQSTRRPLTSSIP